MKRATVALAQQREAVRVLGTRVGPYEVLEKLGSGGMGEVFLCHDSRLHRKVALKCLTSDEPADAQASILREARAVARLTHPHIASVYDVLEQDGRAFIVMEYVEGESLRSRLQRAVLSPDETIAIGRQLASALAAAHRHGVIHRDLKPSNVQLMPDGTVKVLDFGVAKVMPRLDVTDEPTTTNLPSHARSDTAGTPAYMAPEQLVGGFVGVRSDIYSLGVVLFEMATGRRPYAENNAAALAVAMSTSPPPPPDAIDPRVPRRLSSVIVKALQREAFNRYQTADELGAALDELVEPTTREATPVVMPVARRRTTWAVAIAAAVLVVVAAALWRPLMNVAGLRLPPPASAPVLAILPVDNPTDDAQAEHFGAALSSILGSNIRSIDMVRLAARETTAAFARNRRDLGAMKQALAADYVLDLAVTSLASPLRIAVRLSRTDPPAVEWQETITGSPIQVERALLDGLARALTGTRRGIALNADDRARLGRLPTTNATAMLAYVESQALLDRSDVADNVAGAIDRLQSAVAADPNFASGYAALGAVLLMRYERTRDASLLERANAAVSAALRLDPDLSAAQYASGYQQYVNGRREAAIASLERAIALDPDNDAAHRLLGWRLFVSQGRMDEAVSELQRAVRIRNSFDNFYRLGTVLYLAGRYQEAVDAYRKATELQPRRPDAYTNLGAAYHMLGDVKQAIGNYEHAVSLGAGDAQAFGNLAVSYFFSGRFEDALRAGLEATRRDPTRASLQRDLGEYYARVGRAREAGEAYTRAIALARQLLAVDPRDAIAIVTIALCEAHLGQHPAAERHVAEALALSADDRDVQMRAAKTYVLLGNRAAAIEHLRLAVERGYPPQLARDDPELTALKSSPAFETAVSSGQRARARAGASR
jgi:tetratricopeptide (TPR) repeat protein/TolB-like protein/predicted Ser/Thr protein kinase